MIDFSFIYNYYKSGVRWKDINKPEIQSAHDITKPIIIYCDIWWISHDMN